MSVTRRFAVVVNPRSGRRGGLRVLELVKPEFVAANVDIEVHVAQAGGHIEEIVAALDHKTYDGICGIGGDGTIHEIANGIMRRSEVATIPIGIIPAGTGNTLIQQLGFNDPLEAVRRIVRGETQPLDVIRVTSDGRVIYCVNVIGWGAVADINVTAERLRAFGESRYSMAALWNMIRARHRRARITLDGQASDGEFLFVIACNTKHTGSGMMLAPQAEIGDGLVDVVVVRKATRIQMLKLFRSVFDGSHLKLKYVEHHQVRSFAIESDRSDHLDLDGEMKGHTPMSATVLPGALRLFA